MLCCLNDAVQVYCCALAAVRVCNLWLCDGYQQLWHVLGYRQSQVPPSVSSAVSDIRHTDISSICCNVILSHSV